MKRPNWVLWRFRLFLIFIMLAGVAMSYFSGKDVPSWAKEFESVGHAFVIAGILGLTVDAYVKQHLLKEATQDIAKYLIGYQLPNEIQDKIKSLMATQIVARDLNLHYKLTPLPTDSSKLLVRVNMYYEIENMTNEAQKYQQYLYQERNSLPNFLELRCDSTDVQAKYYFGEDDLKEQIKSSSKESNSKTAYVFVNGQEIRIHPHNQNPNMRYRFACRYSLELPDDYSDYFRFDDPTIHVTITAEYPPDFNFHGPSEPVHVNRWEYERLFLNGEHITVEWSRKPQKTKIQPE